MPRTQLNPWTWQDAFGFSQGWRVDGLGSVLFLSGQAPISAEGKVVGEGDFEAQVRQVFSNIGAVLEQGGATFDSIVRLTVYLTDMSNLRDFGRIKGEFISGPQPASTAIGVTSLALPGMMVEVEATAVI
ncbi:MAG TPA: RidA family protein [Acidimicrobiales bacterium]|nr:RidA family protein [Acidimicrobiales bacterium]